MNGYIRETYTESAAFTSKREADDEFVGKFKCTYNDCSKMLSNNVTFMYHLWAHVVRHRTPAEFVATNSDIAAQLLATNSLSDNEKRMSDVERLRTCPECMRLFSNPHKMVLHYRMVHKRNTPPAVMNRAELVCHICEWHFQDVNRLIEHRRRHALNEMPYQCRKCNYRVSSRRVFLTHFYQFHLGTCVLMCPFCTKYFHLSFTERQRLVMTAKTYVEHVMSHEAVNSTFRPPDSGLSSDKIKTVRKAFDVLREPQSQVVPIVNVPRCGECGNVLPTGRDRRKHVSILRKCIQPSCSFQTSCLPKMEFHSLLADCNSNNSAARWPFGVAMRKPRVIAKPDSGDGTQPLREPDVYLMQCFACGFVSANADAMCRHVKPPRIVVIDLDDDEENGESNKKKPICQTGRVRLLRSLYAPLDLTATEADMFAKMRAHFGLDRMLDLSEESSNTTANGDAIVEGGCSENRPNSNNSEPGIQIADALAEFMSRASAIRMAKETNEELVRHIVEPSPTLKRDNLDSIQKTLQHMEIIRQYGDESISVARRKRWSTIFEVPWKRMPDKK